MFISDDRGTDRTSTVQPHMRVLVVTKMWPTNDDSFRNGFLQLQVEAVRKLGVHCDVLVTQDQGGGPLGYLKSALAVRRAVFARRYDLVHAHYGLTAASCLLQPRPLVVTLHGTDINGAVNKAGRTTVKGHIEATISKVVSRRAAVVIAVSSRMAGLIPLANPAVVPVGIDTSLFRPIPQAMARSKLGIDQDKPYVLFAASPQNPVKRFWLAEQAMLMVKRRFPEAELVVVSGQPIERMPLWMNAANALLITSVYEGGPMVHREAMACNLPVVSVDVGDVALHLRHVNLSAITSATPRALAEGIESILEAGMSRSNGRKWAEKMTTDSTAQAIKDVYANAANS